MSDRTILLRTVRDGGRSFCFRGDPKAAIPAFHAMLEKLGDRI
jgi:hypothetical protein